jgi:hypothetical protein
MSLKNSVLHSRKGEFREHLEIEARVITVENQVTAHRFTDDLIVCVIFFSQGFCRQVFDGPVVKDT